MLPAYGAANLRGITPALTGPGFTRNLPAWFPSLAHGADQVVLLVLDGLGWEQFQHKLGLMPVLAGFEGGPITTVAPSTTATALTSIVTGLAPGEHGLIGYRIEVSGEVLNVLRWTTPRGDARQRLRPRDVQPMAPFLGERVPVVSKIELAGSGFSEAHLRGVPLHGWRMPSNIPVQVRSLLEAGERFVYVYYDGIDKTAHEFGFSAFYDQELRCADRLVADVLDALTPGTVLLVTADHGQVIVGANTRPPDPAVLAHVRQQSGEGRFRWLHAKPGAQADLLAAAQDRHGDVAWVVSREQTIDEGWFGPVVSGPVARRLGDVALVPFEPTSFDDPADSGPYQLVSRHGSLTSAEMLVPFVASRR